MLFNAKRFYYGVRRRLFWFVLAVVIPIIYFAGLSLGPDRFAVSKAFEIDNNLPVALVTNPAATRTLSRVVKDDQIFMQNNFNIRKLTDILENTYPEKASQTTPYVLKQTIRNNLSLSFSVDRKLNVTYFGRDKELGKILVNYYSNRLETKIQEGIKRSGASEVALTVPDFNSELIVTPYKSVWRPERIVPLTICFILSFLIVLAIIGALEWSDPAFKSERQMSRYLNLPVIGSIPDLNRISAQLEGK